MKQILVTGATGELGTTVIETLLKTMRAENISVLTRKEERKTEFEQKGLNAFIGQYSDIETLEKAMENVDAVLLISSGDQGDRMQEHKNVINTAKKKGVKNIAYTSRSLKDKNTLVNKLMTEHFLTEDYIKKSGLNYIIFRNALYMDVLPLFVGKQVFEKGIIQPAGNGKVAYVLKGEQAEAMANALMTEKFENQTFNFTGDDAYSFYDVATALTELSGKQVIYKSVEVEPFKKIMLDNGVPKPMVKKIVGFNLDIKNGQEATVTNELQHYLGRKPTNLKEGLKLLFNL
ncbi:SDR family oxidoreductase [Ulvibacter litoralis]|uniref:NAD(P)H dehydrogenase (Quinone) n=1 Tax=Ulvibacter litoralis TaxID=227084 RepID=A0A1G7ICL3_9FLAO|nr:SDR family oxidoreductase [Ulvibacter litoralis]GHC61830.1 NAD(P)-dependent oxidoreductase [Ulvibacter litoralis]SDF10246.1 NAD(P)H dehydrogenase (quinone) [Ulvibacter litoralis]